MKKCYYCNRSGLFLRLDSYGRCPECAAKIERENAETHRLADIYTQFKSANALDLPERISRYEQLLEQYKGLADFSRTKIDLAHFYKLNGQRNAAWSMLNSSQMEAMGVYSKTGDVNLYNHIVSKVRWLQHEILADDQKYIDSVRALSEYYLYHYNNAIETFKVDTFVRRAGPIARKGGLTTAQVRQIGEKLQEHINAGAPDSSFDNWFVANVPAMIEGQP